ncbi:MAG: hypothetical protein IEMM0008_0686 [bacterium]|nr:MAG: hypothetical protein IEMM0008_0686 [bacterium]
MKALKWLLILSITLLPRLIYANSALGGLGDFYLILALAAVFVLIFIIILPVVQIILMVISHWSQTVKYLKAIKVLGWINLVMGILNFIGYILLIETTKSWIYFPLPLLEMTLGFLGIRQSRSKG